MASSIQKLRARILKAFFQSHRVLYEKSGGRLGSSSFGLKMLLLTTIGRKSGLERTTPLVYFRDGNDYVVVGSDGGARRNPHWHENLLANPAGQIQVGRKKIMIVAHEASGPERDRLWAIGRGVNPMWDAYQKRTSREIPMVILREKAQP